MNDYGNCWAVLGLPGPAAERDVKRAYARLLKQTRPEDDAEGFQRLRDAYEAALALAAAGAASSVTDVLPPVAAPAAGEGPDRRDAHVPGAPAPIPAAADAEAADRQREAEAARARHDDWMSRLWHCNDDRRAAAVPGLLDEARTTLPAAEFAVLEATLRHVCAGDGRVTGGFFGAVDAVLGWADAPPALGGEAARLELALQVRREHWRARALLEQRLNALRDALAAQKWEEAAQCNASLQAALDMVPLGWRDWVQQAVVALVGVTRGMPSFLMQRLADAWGGENDVTRRQGDAGTELLQRLEAEKLWNEIDGVRAGRVAADWHYRRAVANLFPRWRWQGWWRWRSLYGLQQQMCRDLLEIMQQRFPWLLERMDPAVVAFWQRQRPALGLYPDRWIAVALLLCVMLTPQSMLTSPPPGAPWLLSAGYLAFVPAFLALRLWLPWHWARSWRPGADALDQRLCARLLPGRWRHAVEQHFRLLPALVRGILIGLVPAIILGRASWPDQVEVDGGSPLPYILAWWGPMALLVVGWRLFVALRGRLPAPRRPVVRYHVDAQDTANRHVPWLSRIMGTGFAMILVQQVVSLLG